MDKTPDLYNIIVSLPAALDDGAVGHFAPALDERALAVSAMRAGNVHTADWVVTWLVDGAPDEAELAGIFGADKWRVEKVADVNWLAHSYKQFEPFTVGEFFIHGSHYEGQPPPGSIPLQIDAATAFGSGEHGTTAGCLRAMLALQEAGIHPRRILDMGTGSGILAVAAAKLWSVPVLAVDIDPESVIVAARHAAANGTGTAITAVQGDGFAAPAVAERGLYDLILANILAGPLIVMAPDLAEYMAPGGHFILSGLLDEQEDDVAGAYRGFGTLVASYVQEHWVAQLWRVKGAPGA